MGWNSGRPVQMPIVCYSIRCIEQWRALPVKYDWLGNRIPIDRMIISELLCQRVLLLWLLSLTKKRKKEKDRTHKLTGNGCCILPRKKTSHAIAQRHPIITRLLGKLRNKTMQLIRNLLFANDPEAFPNNARSQPVQQHVSQFEKENRWMCERSKSIIWLF